MEKFTKIVATIGPASDSIDKIKSLHNAGMNVARLNFSHGDYDYFKKIIANIREVSEEIAILLDTKGPEIRSGSIKDGEILLKDSQDLILTNDVIEGDEIKITINYPYLKSVEVGNLILVDDGLIEMEVLEKQGTDLRVKVLNGGKLGSKKTVAIRGHNVNIPFLSQKDKEDILFGIEQDVDFVAASFVRTKEEVLDLKKFLNDNGGGDIKIISKIEHGVAVENLNEIIDESQGVMVARGDLGVEVPLQHVPKLQEDIIRRCNELGRPVIVATQMLESMKDNPRPTRAEVGDVAQAILQGADAIMLSGETASGKYPEKAVEMMTKIANEYDGSVNNKIIDNLHSQDEIEKNAISIYVTKAAYQASEDLKTRAILTPTESGYTARKVSRFKPKCPIIAMTRNQKVFRQLQISWGVIPMIDEMDHTEHDAMVNELVLKCHNLKILSEKDRVVVTSGHVLSKAGFTNMIEVYKVSCILNRLKNLDC